MLRSSICKMLCTMLQGSIRFCLGFFCPYPFDRYWKMCFVLLSFWASFEPSVRAGGQCQVSRSRGEQKGELPAEGRAALCLRSLCWPRASAAPLPLLRDPRQEGTVRDHGTAIPVLATPAKRSSLRPRTCGSHQNGALLHGEARQSSPASAGTLEAVIIKKAFPTAVKQRGITWFVGLDV